MPAKPRDITGQRFGRLVAIAATSKRLRGSVVWKFHCDCGKEVESMSVEVTRGKTSSCGCLREDHGRESIKAIAGLGSKATTTHGMSNTRTFYTWVGMKDRCLNPSCKDYPRYGGRGIRVCDRWVNSFENFLTDMSEKPKGMTLDRIKVNGNYEPSNCRWATATTQARNRRNNTMLTHNGETKTIAEWAERMGIGSKTIAYRIKAGWSVSDTLTVGVDHGNGWKNGARA